MSIWEQDIKKLRWRAIFYNLVQLATLVVLAILAARITAEVLVHQEETRINKALAAWQ